MVLKNTELLESLRHDFARSAGGRDRARTATFININLDALGVCEWMEAFSVNGTDWALKRMVLHPDESGGVVRQYTQKQYPNINFGEALYHLSEYEDAQAALGFIIDEDDRGQVTGVALFRDVAMAEGIPHDVNGRLVVPQKGHIVEDGAYPVGAFAVAAAGAPQFVKNEVVVSGRSQGVQRSEGSELYMISKEIRDKLAEYGDYILKTSQNLYRVDLTKLLDNKNIIFGYKSGYKVFMNGAFGAVQCVDPLYLANWGPEYLSPAQFKHKDFPEKLLQYLRYQMAIAEVALRSVLISGMYQQAHLKSEMGRRELKALEDATKEFYRAAGKFYPKLASSLPHDKSGFLQVKHHDEVKKADAAAIVLKGIASSFSIDLSTIPDLGVEVDVAPPPSRLLNTGPR
jgi:hypothetical protein